MNCYADDYDTVIAKSRRDATDVWHEHMGNNTADDNDHEEMDEVWERLPRWKMLTVYTGCVYDDDSKPIEKTVSEWIKEKGRCFLCSSEC